MAELTQLGGEAGCSVCDHSGAEAVSWGHSTAKTLFLCHSDTFPTRNVSVTFRSPQGATGRPGHLIKYNETGYNHEASRWRRQDFSDRNCNRDRLRPATTHSSRASPRVWGGGQERRRRAAHLCAVTPPVGNPAGAEANLLHPQICVRMPKPAFPSRAPPSQR